MAAKETKSNIFTVRIKPELLTILERYAEDHTGGNRSAAANYFLELGLQQAGILDKPLTADDVEKIIDARLSRAEEEIKGHTDDSLGKQVAVLNEMQRRILNETVQQQLTATSQNLLEAGESQRDEINSAISEALDKKLDDQLEKIVEQTKPKPSFWQRIFS